MSKPWGKLGAWAAEAEQAELEEKQQQQQSAAAAAAGGDSHSFPPLKEAVTTTKGKKKHKIMSLQEFSMSTGGSAYAPTGALESRRLTPDEMLRLPKGPQERSPEEMQYGRIGGGFSSYGRSGGPRARDREGDGDGNWGGGGGGNRRSYGGGFDDDGRRGGPQSSRVSEIDQPSRADEVDNWAMAKKPIVSSFDRSTNRYGSLGSSGGNDGVSRADEVDNWVVGKKPHVSVAPPPRSSSGFGSGYRDSSGPGPDRWTRGGGGLGGGGGDDRWSRGGGGLGEEQQRPRLVLDKPRTDGVVNESIVTKPATNKPNPFGAARPREEVLSEKGLDWRKVDMEIEAKKTSSRPGSAQSSRPGSAQSEHAENAAALQPGVTKPKVNPFGDAKPREVLLEEKGLDWKKIDLDLERRRVDRPETEAEKNLKVEIDNLKRELEKESASNVNKESQQEFGQEQTSLHERILQKQRELEQITREMDDKVRFVQKPTERPGSGSGRILAVPERPHYRSGSFGDSRNTEYADRPRSRGTGDAWPRQRDERRGFQSGKERGFLGSRDVDRSSERW